MRNVPTLLRRELNAYFASILGYVALMFFLLVMGIIFVAIVNWLNRGPTQMTAMKEMFSMFWLPSLVVVPIITMRLLAEEKRAGTLEMLMTAPVTDFEVVLAKYLGAVVLYSLMWVLTVFYVLILQHFSGGETMLDLGPIVTGYIGVLVIGQFLVAIGLLASSLTRNQVVAAIMSFALIFLFVCGLSWIGSGVETGPVAKLIKAISVFDHMDDFGRGVLDLRPLVLYVTGTVWMLFVTTRVVESRKWR